MAGTPSPTADATVVYRGLEIPVDLPHNFQAEIQLLGAILANNRAYEHVQDVVRVEHFADDRHAAIFAAIAEVIADGGKASAVTLLHIFTANGKLDEIGGGEYLAKLAASAITIINARQHASLIAELARRRQVVLRVLDTLSEIAGAGEREGYNDDFAAALDGTMMDLEAIRVEEGGVPMVHVADAAASAIVAAEKAYQTPDRVVGIPTGLIEIDRALGGLEPGNVYMLAGRPSMGKTALALWASYGAAKWLAKHPVPWAPDSPPGAHVYFAEQEMTTEQIGFRLSGPLAGVDPFRMRTGRIDESDGDVWVRLTQVSAFLKSLPITIDDTPAQTLANIRARARSLKRKHGLGLIVIDHLGLMNAGKDAYRQGEVHALGVLTAGIKAIAKDLRVPVLLLHQLNRGVEHRDDKRPMLADLRDSGKIEQDADAVLFVYRHLYYLERSEPQQRLNESDSDYHDRHENWIEDVKRWRGIGEVIIGKQRNGPVGSFKLQYDEPMSRFNNLAEGQPS